MEKAATPPLRSERIWEIDFLRGVAIILMVGYHLLFDLGEFRGIKHFLGWSTNLASPSWVRAEHFFAGLFVVLSGISSTLTRSNLKRGLRLLVISLLVTAATYAFDPASAIYFGILQCLAISMLLYGAAFEKRKAVACAAWGVIVIGAGVILKILMRGVVVRFDWLLAFGITGPSFTSFDYFPLFPWFGIFLFGSALGKSVYAGRKSLIPLRLPKTFVNLAGRYSLWIYIAHQPIIMGILYLTGGLRP